MKKNPKPLAFIVHPDLFNTAEIQELVRKGHDVIAEPALQKADIVIGPNCYRISRETVGLLELAVKSARAVKYPKKEKDETVQSSE